VADQRLEERTAGDQTLHGRTRRRIGAEVAVQIEPVRLGRRADRAGCQGRADEAGEPPFQLDLTGREQRVDLAALGDSRPGTDRAGGVGGDPLVRDVERGQVVPLDDQHLVGVVAEDPGGHQPGDAAADDDGPPEQDLVVIRGYGRRDLGETTCGGHPYPRECE
jgi:hypothetical protein